MKHTRHRGFFNGIGIPVFPLKEEGAKEPNNFSPCPISSDTSSIISGDTAEHSLAL
jgi:hypothetical protein